MKKTNKVFLFVLGLLTGVLLLAWQAIQTDKFGDFVSERVSKYASKKYGANLKFDKIQFGFFPVKTKLINVEVEYENYYLSSSQAALVFGLRDIFSKEFSIGSIELKDALVTIPSYSKNEEKSKEFKLQNAFKYYKNDFLNSLPFRLRGVSLDNAILNIGKERIEAIYTRLSFFKNILTVEMSVGFSRDLVSQALGDRYRGIEVNGFNGEFQLTSDYLRLKEARLLSENSYIELSGKLFYTRSFQGLSIDSFVNLNKFRKLIPEDVINPKILPKGSVRMSGVLDGNSNNPRAKIEIDAKNIKSEVYNFNWFKSKLAYRDNDLILEEAEGAIGSGLLKLTSAVKVFNKEKGDFLYPDFFLDVKNVFTNDLMFFLPNLNRAKGYLNGPVKFGIRKTLLDIKTFEGFEVKNFQLVGSERNVIQNPQYYLSSGSNLIVSYDGDVNFDMGLGFKDSLLETRGSIANGRVDVSVLPSTADLEEFGPISGVVLKGRGDINGTIKGTFDDPIFDFFLSPANAELVGFKLGDVKTNITYRLKDNLLKINSLRGDYRGLRFSGLGEFNFNSDLRPMDLSINIDEGAWKEAKVALQPIFKPIIPNFKDAQFNFGASLRVVGGFDIPEMNVRGVLKASNFLWHAEDIETISTSFKLEDSVLTFPDIRAQKVSGSIFGKANYNFKDGGYSYEGSVTNLRVKDIFYYRLSGLGLDGDIFGEFNGYGDKDVFSSRTHIRLTNSVVESTKLKDSILTVYNNKKDLFYSASGIGGQIKIEGYLNLDEKSQKRSNVKSNVNITNLRSILGILNKHNIEKRNLSGSLIGTLEGDFDVRDFGSLNLKAVVNQLSFRFTDINLIKNKNPYVFEIKNGVFENWNQTINGEGITFKTMATGALGTKVNFLTEFKFSSSVFELISSFIENSRGQIKGTHKLTGDLGHLDQFMTLKGEGMSLKAKSLPGIFSNVMMDVHFEKEAILLNKIKARYGNGDVQGQGKIKLKFPFPKVELFASIEKTKIPLLKKSGIVVSGDLNLTGESLPYDLKGNLAIIQGEIVETMNDLASNAVENNSYQRFIPVGYIEGNVSFINSDLIVTSFSPILIKNGMINLGLGGNLRVFGSVSNPKVNGELSIENPENKFIFKGHEFILSEGNLKFLDGVRKEPPELRFNGVARINDYDIFISVAGPSDSMKVEMASNPPLSQEDILSLLTLGVTSDVSRNLGDRQRQSVTTLSIGTLLIDQLRINQSLNDSLGLRVSIQPEFIEDENNLLEGRVEDRGGGSRFRSSTVLKVQKRVSKKMNLSLSSTVGGSVDQSQEMNLNYKINRSWSLEGVYEVRSNDELEQELPDSAGVDVKFQWSF